MFHSDFDPRVAPSRNESKHGWKNPDPSQGLRSRSDRSGVGGHRADGGEDGSAGLGPDSATDEDAAVDGAPLAARRQEVARAVRAQDAQARDRHSRFARADGGRADEARSAGWRGRRNQSGVTGP